MKTYYGKRASIYEQSMYLKKELGRNKDTIKIKKLVRQLFKNREIIEAACGTGYWTEILSVVAKKIIATDVVPEVLAIAKEKKYLCPTELRLEDAFNLHFKAKSFNAGLANFWISHIIKKDLTKFLKSFHKLLKHRSIVFFCDNVFNSGKSEKNFIKEGENGFKIRKLYGEKYKVIKNYYSKGELVKIFSSYARSSSINVVIGKWAWWVWYETK